MNPTILVLAAGNERGGAANHILTLARAVVADKPQARFRFVLVGSGFLADRLQTVSPAAVVPLPSHPAKAVSALRALLAAEGQPAILHAHGPRINLLARVACGRRFPWTTTLHSNPYNDFLSSRWKSMLLPRLNLWALRRASGVFVVNPLFAEFVPNQPSVWVPNSIPMTRPDRPKAAYEQALRQRLDLPQDAKLVGIAARFDPVKDIPTLIRAIHRLGRTDVHLALAGDGPERETLERVARDVGVRERVHFLGFLDDVQAFYGGLQVHVLSSRSEGAPTSLLEAGLAGVVNVGSDIPGITRLLEDGESGLCFQVGDADDLAQKLALLLDHSDMAARMAARFSAEVLPRYTPDAMLQGYLNGYRQLFSASLS